MLKIKKVIPSIITLLLMGQASALMPGDRVENFKLLDHQGKSQELYYNSDATVIVLMVQGNGCPIVRNAMPALHELRARYEQQGVRFLLINSNLQDTRATVNDEVDQFGYELPILMDESQLIGEALGLDRTGEVLVIDTAEWKLRYRGAIDDRLTYERQQAKAREHYLEDALDALLSENPIPWQQTGSPGCLINFTDRDNRLNHKKISYTEMIAPILIDNCVICHNPGGIGPWAMTDYNMIKGFSPMMREVIRTGRMPPWHADPHVGDFANDRSLSISEMQTLVHWIEAGSPRGDGVDPLTTLVKEKPEWRLGQPDLVINLPSYEVPASGVVDYQYFQVNNPLDHDVWVKAAELVPGDSQALHHVITRFTLISDDNAFTRRDGGGFGGYVPGYEANWMPRDTGILLPAGAEFTFQMHYTPYGKATTDQSRLGLYFHDTPPTHRLVVTALINLQLRIPPNTKEHSEEVSYVFPDDVLVYGMLPHAHYRGKAARYNAVYPDGREEILLSVPDYDFNWQTFYRFEKPRRIPKGTRITFTMTWDNSVQNPANPDPEKEIRWGRQSWHEMQFGTISFRLLTEEERIPGTTGIDETTITVRSAGITSP